MSRLADEMRLNYCELQLQVVGKSVSVPFFRVPHAHMFGQTCTDCSSFCCAHSTHLVGNGGPVKRWAAAQCFSCRCVGKSTQICAGSTASQHPYRKQGSGPQVTEQYDVVKEQELRPKKGMGSSPVRQLQATQQARWPPGVIGSAGAMAPWCEWLCR